MDSKDNFLKAFGKFIKTINKEYLVGISNKGIINRAEKDLCKVSNFEYEIKDKGIEFKIDDINCLISEDIQKYQCSCPSRSICKHVIMCYLYLIENQKEIFKLENSEDEYKEDNEEFLKLKEFKIEDIKKKIGEKSLENIVKRIEYGMNFKIKEGSIIEVDFNDEGILVKLLDDIENSICSCKSKELCVHKAEALILYKLEKGYLKLEKLKDSIENELLFNKDEMKKAAVKLRQTIEDIFITGLSRTPITILDKLNSTAVICHNYELPNFEKSIRDIREEFLLYFNKNASFTAKNLLNKLTNLYTRTISMENIEDLNKLSSLVGEFKSSYYEIPPVELHGFGAEKWKSKSGYEGITYYFLENKRKQIYTYTHAIPTYYDNVKVKRNFNEAAPWELNCSVQELSKITFKLVHGKINSANRISSSSESKGTIIDKSYFSKLNVENFTYDNWQQLLEKIFLNDNEKNENYNLVFLNINEFGESNFDNITQEFSLPIYDKEKNVCKILVKFSSESKKIIRTLERLVKYKKTHLFMGRVYIDKEKLMFYPISYYDDAGEVENLTV
ncbi:SWIM zinc finger family protein [Clostridium scatologenes]|uniref:Zinc finger SWIM domain protein n=1 Tax=Clostridium scatologenes TaxID=1548 RepID=A0A0E3M575_CLOSL|nr:SWIM zinc finger family protein [Clostridium scatologenes]AKA68159.1 zinc finger SWIM domain protein [Clostridium scatologenes]